jgi:zinc transporter 1/2/3
MPGVIMMAAMFALFVIEMWLNGKMGGHSHGGPMGFEAQSNTMANPAMNIAQGDNRQAAPRGPPPPRPPRYTSTTDFEIEDIEYEKKMAQKMYEEKMRNYAPQNPFGDNAYPYTDPGNPYADDYAIRSQMPPWFIVFYEQYCRQRLEMFNMIKEVVHKQKQQEQQQQYQETPVSTKRQTLLNQSSYLLNSPYIDVETGQPVHPDVYKRMSTNITLLEGGILFHSVFVGMTISITIDGFIVLVVAMLFHQMFEGLGLGSRIAEVPYKRGSPRPWILVMAFGLTCPIGQAIGLVARGAYDPNSAFGLIIVGVFNAM